MRWASDLHDDFLGVLHSELEIVQTATLESPDKGEFVSDFCERLGVVLKSLLVGDSQAW
jgi:hypothetical protein